MPRSRLPSSAATAAQAHRWSSCSILARFLHNIHRNASPATGAIAAPHVAAVFRIQQFLYFFPLPHGHGSLRPILAPALRIGSIFFAGPWLAAAVPSSLAAVGRGAASCTVALIDQIDSSKLSS